MSHFNIQLHREATVAFSTSRAFFTIEEHRGSDSWSAHGWTEVTVTLAKIGPQLYVLIATPLASTLLHSQAICPLARCLLWECSGSGYDEDSRRVWISPTPESRVMFCLAEDVEYWALVRLIFEARDVGCRRRDEVERLAQQAVTLVPRVVDENAMAGDY